MIKDTTDILSIANHFQIVGHAIGAMPFGSGHINDTYRVKTDVKDDETEYLFQKINHTIFKDVDSLMKNIFTVCSHIKGILAYRGPQEVLKRSLTIIPTREGLLYYLDDVGQYWRMFVLIKDTKTYDMLETVDQAYAGGRAFGEFQKQLVDLDPQRLVDVLPHFHDIDFRLQNLYRAVEADPVGRASEAAVLEILAELEKRSDDMHTISRLGKQGAIPRRIIHNDTKFNNILLDVNDHVQCVIDLDTVMPGFVACDFGDAIRTIINTVAEDESNLSRIQLNIDLFEAYAIGYLCETREFLTNTEIESLLEGVYLMPYLQVVRFLTDYIAGDIYYKVAYPMHNLVRARAQFKLLTELELHRKELDIILKQAFLAPTQ